MGFEYFPIIIQFDGLVFKDFTINFFSLFLCDKINLIVIKI